MGESTSKIEAHIAQARQDLSANFQELEEHVKDAADLRRQVQRRPLAFTGIAFAAGLVAAALLRRK